MHPPLRLLGLTLICLLTAGLPAPLSAQQQGPGAADAVDAAAARARHHLALAGEGRTGDPPPVADGTDAPGVGDAHLVEEHLVEVDLAADVP